MTTIEVPCNNCVLIAMCRNKLFDEVIGDCKLLLDSLYFDKTTPGGSRSTLYGDKLIMIQDILNPEHWKVDVDEDKYANIRIIVPNEKVNWSPISTSISTRIDERFIEFDGEI